MSMHGGTIRILEAAHFTTPQAVAIAEAIDSGIRSADLVTVPVLDARFAQFEVRILHLMDERFGKMDERLGRMDERISGFDERMAGYFWRTVGLGLTAMGILLAAMKYLR